MELLCSELNYFQLRCIKPEAPRVQKQSRKTLNSSEWNREITANETSWMIAASEYGMSCNRDVNHQTAQKKEKKYVLLAHSPQRYFQSARHCRVHLCSCCLKACWVSECFLSHKVRQTVAVLRQLTHTHTTGMRVLNYSRVDKTQTW